MMILSSLSSNEIRMAILKEDIVTLKSIKGIGMKSAQRIIIDLKDKMTDLQIGNVDILNVNNNNKRNEALSALETLGFSIKDINKVLDGVLSENPDASVEQVIKMSLKSFSFEFFQKSYFIKYFIFLIFSFFSENILAQDDNSVGNNLSIDFLTPTNFIDSLSYNNNEIIFNKYIGNFFLGERLYFSQKQYQNYLFNKQFQEYWKNRISSNSTDLNFGGEIPKVGLGGEVLNKIFGSNSVSIRPQGAVELTFAGVVNRIDNPALPEAQRKTTSFNFDERIQINVLGRIGEKLQLQANYDTEATFEFENEMKLEYTGDEDDIIKK